MSSYILFHLVYAYYLLFNNKNPKEQIKNNYHFIIKFLEYYGFEFKYEEDYIYFTKKEQCKIMHKNWSEDNLKILDISDNGQEIGRTCFRYSTVRLFFQCMYNNLIENYDRMTSVLEILGLME